MVVYFHLTQSTWRKVQELGLVVAFNTDAVFKEFVAMIDALTFLPINDVTAGMAYLPRNVHPQAIALLDYFDRKHPSPSWTSPCCTDASSYVLACDMECAQCHVEQPSTHEQCVQVVE